MKTICNSCVGSFLTRCCYNTPLITPFNWCQLDAKSALYLITNWNNINFEDYELIKDDNWNFSILIEKEIQIRYVHYKFDSKVNGVKKIGGDKVSNKIWEFIINLYERRVKQMEESNEEPIFIFSTVHETEPNYFTEKQREQIAISAKKNNLKVIFAYHDISDAELNKSNEQIEYIRLSKRLNRNTLPTSDFIFHNSKLLKSL